MDGCKRFAIAWIVEVDGLLEYSKKIVCGVRRHHEDVGPEVPKILV